MHIRSEWKVQQKDRNNCESNESARIKKKKNPQGRLSGLVG